MVCLMTVERRLSPPHLNKRELIYCGEEIELTEIPKKLNLKEKTAKNYYYTISQIKRVNNAISVSSGVFCYDELLKGMRNRDGYWCDIEGGFEKIELPARTDVRKNIVDLLVC